MMLVEIAQSIITNDAPEVFPLGETLVTWTATDTHLVTLHLQLKSISVIDTTLSYRDGSKRHIIS